MFNIRDFIQSDTPNHRLVYVIKKYEQRFFSRWSPVGHISSTLGTLTNGDIVVKLQEHGLWTFAFSKFGVGWMKTYVFKNENYTDCSMSR